MSNEKEEDVECSICGVCLEKSFTHQLCCGHTFHYECLMKTFIHTKKYTSNYNNCCPYCNVKCGYLPVVNGLKPPPKTPIFTLVSYVLEFLCFYQLSQPFA